MEKDKISVIVPVYKVEKYLPKCLDSIINQTYKNLEIILVDDGSPDNSGKICDEYAEKDSRIKVFHKKNGGLASARNAGIAVMTGDYVTFIDSDDYIKENMIERMAELRNKENADVVQISFEREESEFDKQCSYDACPSIIVGKENIKNYALDRIYRPEACGKLYKTLLLEKIRFDEKIKYAEDLEFGLRFYKNVKKALICDEKLYFYRQNNNSLTSSSLSEGRLNEPIMLLNAAMNEKDDKSLYECIMFRYVRCSFAVMNRMVSENKGDRYEPLREKLISLSSDIVINKYIGVKYKIGMLILIVCKSFKRYRSLISLIRR